MNGMLSWALASSTDLNRKHFRPSSRFASAGGGGGGDFLTEPTSVLDISSSLSPSSAISPSLGSSDSTYLDIAAPPLPHPPSFFPFPSCRHPCHNNDSEAGEEEEEGDLMLLGLLSPPLDQAANCSSAEDFHCRQWRRRQVAPPELGGQGGGDPEPVAGDLESVCYPVLMNGRKDGDDIAAVAAPFKRKESGSDGYGYGQKVAEPPMVVVSKGYGPQAFGMEDLDSVLQASASPAPPDQSLMKWLLGEREEDWRSPGHGQGSSSCSSSSSSLSSSSSSKSGLAKVGTDASPAVVPLSFPFVGGNSSLQAMPQFPFLDMASSSSSSFEQQQRQQQQQASLLSFATPPPFSSELPPALAPPGCSLFDGKAVAGPPPYRAYNLACKEGSLVPLPCEGQHKLYPEESWVSATLVGGGGGGGGEGNCYYLPLCSVKNEFRPSPYHGFYSPQQPLPPPPLPDMTAALVESLLKVVEAAELGQAVSAHVILARLNHFLVPDGKPLRRAAFYFKEALTRQLPNPASAGMMAAVAANPLPAPALLDKFSAYRSFCSLSPLPQFSHFTLNQAILEAVEGDGSVHLIDFDLGPGGQWASLLQELATRQQGAPNVRMTVVGADSTEARLAVGNLIQFARSVKLPLEVEAIPTEVEHVTLPLFRCRGSEARVVNLGTGIRAPRSFSSMHALTMFLQLLEGLSPNLITLVDSGPNGDARGVGVGGRGAAGGFPQRFLDSLQHHAVVFESLESITGMDVQKAERHLFAPEIEAIVNSSSHNNVVLCRSLLQSTGFAAPMPFSIAAQAQAEYLAAQRPGFNVLRSSNHDSLLLAWQGRVLASASIWTVTNHTPA